MRVKREFCILCCLVLLTAVVFSVGCFGQEKATVSTPDSSPRAVIITDPKEYFPMIGTWSYNVEFGKVEPLLYQATKDWVVRRSIGSEGLQGKMKIRTKVYYLAEDGNEATELEVLRDDLGVLGNVKSLTWILSGESVEQTTYHAEGVSVRSIFFLPSPGQIKQKKSYYVGNEETLTFVGLDDKISGCQEQACLYFIREIKAGAKPDHFDKGFVEYKWFAKGKGLILLRQEIEGQTSMTWTLEQYVPG